MPSRKSPSRPASPQAPSPPSSPSPPSKAPTQEELQQSLERLHAELAASARLDTHSRALLHEVLADIRRLLAAPTTRDSDEAIQSAPRRLANLAIAFEARHPVLATNVRQFVDLLGRAGL